MTMAFEGHKPIVQCMNDEFGVFSSKFENSIFLTCRAYRSVPLGARTVKAESRAEGISYNLTDQNTENCGNKDKI